MKRLLFAFTLMLFTASLASAQEKEAAFALVGDATFDFGTIKESDGPVTHSFTVKNEGEAPLVITRVQPSCGCTTPEYTKAPIDAGKTGEIKVTFDPRGVSVPFTKTIAVFSNGKAGSVVLTIKGNVTP